MPARSVRKGQGESIGREQLTYPNLKPAKRWLQAVLPVLGTKRGGASSWGRLWRLGAAVTSIEVLAVAVSSRRVAARSRCVYRLDRKASHRLVTSSADYRPLTAS